MAPQLNREEQARVDKLDEMKRHQRTGERLVTDGMIAARQQLVDFAYRNAEARERNRAERKAEEDAKTAARQAERDAAAQAQIAAFKQEARRRFPGTDVEFEREWPAIKSEWQRRLALSGAEDEARLAQKRRLMNSF